MNDRTSLLPLPVDGSGALAPGAEGEVSPALEFLADTAHPAGAVAFLRSAKVVRERAHALLARARRGESAWFTLGDDPAFDDAARTVCEVTLERYPWDAPPPHSRWRHFEAGGEARLAQLDARLGPHATPRQRARMQIDLVLVSVLLDADAGPDWHYTEPASGLRLAHSEGLAVACFHAFTSGLFSSDPEHPLQADAAGLRALVTDRLAQAFQVSAANPLAGLAGRATLLRRLGEALAEQPEVFGSDGRPGGLIDMLVSPSGPAAPPTADITAHEILAQLLMSLSRLGPTQNAIDRVAPDGRSVLGSGHPDLALGDCWRHSAVRGPGLTDGWMPLHTRSQWLTYSLIEPFEWAGVTVRGLEELTGLAEDGHGGLFLDSGVLLVRDPALLARRWQAGDEFIVEWRALTVALLDELAPRVRKLLGRSAADMPLASVLEGGTWAAGRALAQRLRGGAPPLPIESDGTVF